MKRSLEYPDIGTVTFIKRANNRNIRITVKSDSSVLVTYPTYISYRRALRFFKKQLEWIKISQQKYIEKQTKSVKISLMPECFNNGTIISMIGGDLIIKRTERSIASLKIKDLQADNLLFPLDEIVAQYHEDTLPEKDRKFTKHDLNILFSPLDNSTTIFYPNWWPDEIKAQSSMYAVIERISFEIIRQRAKQVLKEKVDLYSSQYNLKYNQLRVKNLRRIWGSCSHRDNLNLNIKLVLLPEHLCDMIVKHELSHLQHKNHGQEFYKLLDNMCDGNLKEMRKELKRYIPR